AETLARNSPGAIVTDEWREAIDRSDVDVVIVATINKPLAEITRFSVERGKHVLVEKPAARTTAEIDAVIAAATSTNRLVRVGFNHRYHPALRKARELVDARVLGDMMFVRGRYGHGGRVGYDREWRANPELSGGGELIDQGVHLIDLAGWFLGDFDTVEGHAVTYFWDMPVDDNAFLSIRSPTRQTAWLHVSCTEWKNLFSLELYGRDGKLAIDGLGGSYGTERLAFYKMLPEMGPPETIIFEYPRSDSSWALEMAAFTDDIRHDRRPEPGLREAIRTLKTVEKIYRESGFVHSPIRSK